MVGVGDALAHQVRSDQTRTMNLAPIKRPGRRLTALLRIDGSISLGFGIATALFQSAIFNTAVDLKSAGVTGRGDSLMESALLTLSGYYVLVGALLLLLAGVPSVYANRICMAVALHHGFMAFKGVAEAKRAWVTGDPWWDIAIHLFFVAAYLCCLLFASATHERGSAPPSPSL